MHLAWRTYEPVTLAEAAARATPPTRQAIEDKFLDDWKALVDLKWQTVSTEAKHASAADPSSGKPWLRLGFLAVDFHRFDDAKAYFMKARQDPATAAAAYNNLGNLAFIRGEMETALSDYAQAREKDPTDAEIALNIVRVNLKQGHPQKASEEYEKAMALDKSLKEQYPDVSALTP